MHRTEAAIRRTCRQATAARSSFHFEHQRQAWATRRRDACAVPCFHRRPCRHAGSMSNDEPRPLGSGPWPGPSRLFPSAGCQHGQRVRFRQSGAAERAAFLDGGAGFLSAPIAMDCRVHAPSRLRRGLRGDCRCPADRAQATCAQLWLGQLGPERGLR